MHVLPWKYLLESSSYARDISLYSFISLENKPPEKADLFDLHSKVEWEKVPDIAQRVLILNLFLRDSKKFQFLITSIENFPDIFSTSKVAESQ